MILDFKKSGEKISSLWQLGDVWEICCVSISASAPELSAYLPVVVSSGFCFVLSWEEMGMFSTAVFSKC